MTPDSPSLDRILSLVSASQAAVLAVAADLEELRARPPSEREMAERLAACALMLRSIGGPTDPNKPAGG
jgi:hypothetical protein